MKIIISGNPQETKALLLQIGLDEEDIAVIDIGDMSRPAPHLSPCVDAAAVEKQLPCVSVGKQAYFQKKCPWESPRFTGFTR